MKGNKTYSLELMINGKWKRAEVTPEETLLHLLREKLGHTEVKEGCGKGDCGACAVLLDGKAVNACLTLALQAHKQKVVTLRGIGTPAKPHPLQESFVKRGAIQCGFCTAGMIVSAQALLDENPRPTREEIRKGISGNLCRCTGYKKIIDAIEDVSKKLR
ncbi:MAG TPA: (2Fe-2S)-binding protein [Candidatus Hodarchaeales archaeon]|nr:(2Fe-2S)-binding protein [Candidatus Hodarchaeales archaeon]